MEKRKKQKDLANVSIIIQDLGGEEMDGADLPKLAPPGTVGSKDEVLIIISNIFGSGIGRSAREISVMDFQELSGDGGRGSHDDVDESQAEVHQRAVLTS